METTENPDNSPNDEIDVLELIDTWPIEHQIGFYRGAVLQKMMSGTLCANEARDAAAFCVRLANFVMDAEEDHSSTAPVVVPPPPEYDPASVALPDADGWIPWHGGKCPLPSNQSCYLRFRSGREYYVIDPTDYYWKHTGNNHIPDIIAYKPATTT